MKLVQDHSIHSPVLCVVVFRSQPLGVACSPITLGLRLRLRYRKCRLNVVCCFPSLGIRYQNFIH
jgi:hypothetical protein